jgi:hypothetical protein
VFIVSKQGTEQLLLKYYDLDPQDILTWTSVEEILDQISIGARGSFNCRSGQMALSQIAITHGLTNIKRRNEKGRLVHGYLGVTRKA